MSVYIIYIYIYIDVFSEFHNFMLSTTGMDIALIFVCIFSLIESER